MHIFKNLQLVVTEIQAWLKTKFHMDLDDYLKLHTISLLKVGENIYIHITYSLITSIGPIPTLVQSYRSPRPRKYNSYQISRLEVNNFRRSIYSLTLFIIIHILNELLKWCQWSDFIYFYKHYSYWGVQCNLPFINGLQIEKFKNFFNSIVHIYI